MMMHLLRCGSVKYVKLRLSTILARSVLNSGLVFPFLAGASLIVGWTLSLTICCLEKPERTEIKQVTEICFFHFYSVHNTGANFIPCTKHNMHIGPQHIQSEFYSTHFHNIICDGSFINHSFKSLILKIAIYVYDVLR